MASQFVDVGKKFQLKSEFAGLNSPAAKQQYEEDKEEEKMLKELDYYHGFLPREDLQFLIKKDGDFILRTSEVDAPSQSAESLKCRRELILSLYSDLDNPALIPTEAATVGPDAATPPPQSTRFKMRNMIVKKIVKGKYGLEPERLFDSLKELIAYYQNNVGIVTKIRFQLKNGVKQQPWELLHKDIELNKDKLLGEGAYGEVRQGILHVKGEQDKEVAVKVTKSTVDLNKGKIKEMMREARLVRNLKHPNIVRLWGVAVDEQPLYIVLELIKGGALNSYLQKNKCSVEEKMAMVLGAARGVDHLHKNGIIHRDLAARNCLYDNAEKCVKISDFGLSRKDVKVYKIKVAVKLPIKWLAPETIASFIFTLKTDVWSFGVMTYEIFVNGGEPWEGATNTEVKKAVTAGKCVPMTGKGIPENVIQFLTGKVFTKDPAVRVDIPDIVKFFEGLVGADPAAAAAAAAAGTDVPPPAQSSPSNPAGIPPKPRFDSKDKSRQERDRKSKIPPA